MKRFFAMAAAVGVAGAPAWAQPAAEHEPHEDAGCCLEGYPAGAVPVPGAAGAMAHPDVPPGYVLIEGDIQVRLEEYAAHLAGLDSTFGTVTFWGSTVPFGFSANVNATNQQRAIDAMAQISARAGITFVARTSQSNWIQFNDSTGNNSPVGMQGGVQTINLFNWGTQIVICHEVYHSLGFWHEQSRPDRNTYVTINAANIEPGFEHNFDIRSGASTYGFYDFDSFMHYGRTAFSSNGQNTIVVNQPWTSSWQNAIGQRTHFSYYDEVTCRGIYRFAGDRWWAPGAGGNGSGNIVNPLSHSTFGGAYSAAPAGGTLFIKNGGSVSAIGTYVKAMTLEAPQGATLGN